MNSSQLIPHVERRGKSKHGTKAKMAGFPKILSRRARGFLQGKKRFTTQHLGEKRVERYCLRKKNEENLPDIFHSLNNNEELAREGASNRMNGNKRRRMATCEQLEKITCTCDGKRTLYDLRKALVVVKRLENYGLL